MAHAQKPDFVFRRSGRVHLNQRGRQFSRLLAADVCASADTPCSEVVRRVLATHSIRQFPLHFPSRASPCAITFQLESTTEQYDWGFQGFGIYSDLIILLGRDASPSLCLWYRCPFSGTEWNTRWQCWSTGRFCVPVIGILCSQYQKLSTCSS